MTRDNIIRMAQEAGLIRVVATHADGYINRRGYAPTQELERFAAIVAAAEREACANACEDIPLPQDLTELTHLPTIERCIAVIRERGEI